MSLTEGDHKQLYRHVLTDHPSAALAEWTNFTAKRQPRSKHHWLSLDLHLPTDLVKDLSRLFKMPLATKTQQSYEEKVQPDVTFDSDESEITEDGFKGQNASPTSKVTKKATPRQIEKAEHEARRKASDLALVRYEEELKTTPGVKRSWEDIKDKELLQKEALAILKKIKIKKEPSH